MYQMKQGGDGKRYVLKKFLYTEISNKWMTQLPFRGVTRKALTK